MHALTLWFSAAWSSAWAPLAVDVIVKATVMLLLAVVAAALLHRSSAAVRHRVWCLTFAALLLLPALSAGLPEWRLEVLPTVVGTLRVPQLNALDASPAESGAADAQRLASADTRTTSRAALFADSPPFAAPGGPLAEREDYGGLRFANRPDAAIVDGPGPSSATSRGPLGLAALWLLGAMIAASPLAAGLLRKYLLRRRARPVAEAAWTGLLDELRSRLSLRRRVALYETRAALMPMTWGMFAPVVLLPHAAREWTERLRRFVLLHELAHVKRCDVGFQMLARLACALYWFHPLAWYALRRLRIERELACDDCVVQAGERPSDYAAELLAIARHYRPLRLAAAVPMAQTSNLERRIRALFDKACSHLPISPAAARLLLLGTAAIVTTIAVIRLAPRAAAEADERSAAETQSDVAQPPSAGTAATADDDVVTVSGRVLDPDGNPFPGAKIFAARWYWEPHIPHPPLAETKSGAGGRFTISFRKSQFDVDVSRSNQWEETAIVATADGFAVGWVTWRNLPRGGGATLRLVTDDTPIRGRVVDLEGKPVSGIAVRVGSIHTGKGGNFDAWLAAVARGEFPWTAAKHLEDDLPQFDGWPPRVVTGDDGRFRVNGIGRERGTRLSFSGSTIAYQEVEAVTRRSGIFPLKFSRSEKEFDTVYGADFELVAAPTQPVTGIVRDAETRQPLAGVSIESNRFAGSNFVNTRQLRAVSDEQGRYRLVGMPKGEGNRLLAVPNDDQPYLMRDIDVPESRGLRPVDVDIELHRGIWITGRVSDLRTGEPLPARLHYLPFRSNEYAQTTPEFGETLSADSWGFQNRYVSRPDGTYRLVGLPGRAIVGAECVFAHYRKGVGAEHIVGMDEHGHFDTYCNPVMAGKKWPSAMKEINPSPGAKEIICDLALDPGEAVKVDVLDLDGKPVDSFETQGSGQSRSDSPDLRGSFDVITLGPEEIRTVVIRQKERKLGKVIRVSLADHPSQSFSVALEPMGRIVGRLLDRQGTPISGAAVEALLKPTGDFSQRLPPTATDEHGRFEYTDIATGCHYLLRAEAVGMARGGRTFAEDVAVEPGETKDLGDVTIGGAERTAEKSEPAKPADQSQSPGGKGENASTAITLRGRVLDPAGKPLPGARLRVIHVDTESNTWVERSRLLAQTKSDADGAFSISFRDAAPFATSDHFVLSNTVLLADAPGVGFDWEPAWPGGEPLTLQLVDDAAIKGRVLDLEGRPIAGVDVTVEEVSGEAEGIDAWIEKAKQNPVSLDPDQMARPIKDYNTNRGPTVARFPGNDNVQLGSSEFLPSAVTDAGGKFRLAGLGRDRLVRLRLDGSGIAKTWLNVVTHDMQPVPYPSYDPRFRVQTCFGREFDLTAEPEQPIAGTIRDADTGEPLPGVEVRLSQYAGARLFVEGFVSATTDEHGRYTLRGVPKPSHPEQMHLLRLLPGAGRPYFKTEARAPKQQGLGSVTCDVALKRGITALGKVTDASTGKPVRGLVAYVPFLSNQAAAAFPNFVPGHHTIGVDEFYATDDDGRYEVPALPGRGVVAFIAEQADRYPKADGADNIADLYPADRQHLNIYHLFGAEVATALREVNLSQIGDDAPLEIALRPLSIARLELTDPEGRPLVGVVTKHLVPARMHRSYSIAWSYEPLRSPITEIIGSRDNARTAMFLHRERRLAAAVRLAPDRDPPAQVVLHPCATMTGRVVDAVGNPVAKLWFEVHAAPLSSAAKRDQLEATLARLQTNAEGRFRLDDVPPGLPYILSAIRGAERVDVTTKDVQPGETLDLGDVALKAPK